MMIKNKNKHNLAIGLLVLGTMLVSVITASFDIDGFLYRTSILDFPEHAPFDGTVNPIQKVPNWVKLDSTKWKSNYSTLTQDELTDLPYYNPEQLKTATDSLQWGNVQDDTIRNAKITYSVPYLGNYKLDGLEYSGSHPAVDIKIPEGTPIFAIANGTVIKVANQTSGFGKHIVIQHNNFPNFDNPDVKEIIYSSYSHLSEILVEVGDVVTKGTQIALSGMTGTATTPHLHFQIDNDQAPWHPFWPFTWSEISEAGLSFFDAINTGFGQSNAIATTINPMKYVQKYLDPNAVLATNVATIDNQAVSYVNNAEIVETAEEVSAVATEPVLNFQFEVSPYYYKGQNADFNVLLRGGFSGDVVVFSVDGHATASEPFLTNASFDKEGINQNSFKRMSVGRDKLQITYNGENFYSDWFEIKDGADVSRFSDVSEDNKYYKAVDFLVTEGIINGYPDGTFKPDQTVNRVEALKFILEAIDAEILSGDLPFYDVSATEWYSNYLYTGYNDKIVNGNPDGSFRPSDSVNKAEFFKILFNGMKVDINPEVSQAPYKDVNVNDWFAPYVAYAKEIGIIDGTLEDIGPSNAMNRGEVAEAIYRVMKIVK